MPGWSALCPIIYKLAYPQNKYFLFPYFGSWFILDLGSKTEKFSIKSSKIMYSMDSSRYYHYEIM